MKFTAQTFKLQDGSLCNPSRRLKKRFPTLFQTLSSIPDGRSNQGKRHSLLEILGIIMGGLTVGCCNITECLEWAKSSHGRPVLSQCFAFPHGIPHATTLSRALAKINETNLVQTVARWRHQVFGFKGMPALAMDGKTENGIHGGRDRHILSLFTHHSFYLLGQITLPAKENEITASAKLFTQTETDLFGTLITADAFLTRKHVIANILDRKAQYLLIVKKNNRNLHQIISSGFADPHLEKDCHKQYERAHGREVTTTVEISQDFYMEDIREEWSGVRWMGHIHREGTRPVEELGTGIMKQTPFSEDSYFITSLEDLTAKEAADLIKGHWGIENNLHWQKDWSYREDQQTLRRGNAAKVMSFLKGLCLELLHRCGIHKISQTLRSYAWETPKQWQFLQKAHII